MTPEDKAKEILDYMSLNLSDPIRKIFESKIAEAIPREVSEDELKALSAKCAEEVFFSDSPNRVAPWAYELGFREAMRRNAMAKLESLWPSEAEFSEMLFQYFGGDIARLNFPMLYKQLKARVLGGEK